MKDIETREDIIFIMRKFYDKLLVDNSINHFFTKTTNVFEHLEEHFETLATFWEQALFLKGGYKNNMFQKHLKVHEKSPFKLEHYQTWLHHLHTTIDENFEGEYAEQMKTMSQSMATVMQIKF
jgi:hemoglobin